MISDIIEIQLLLKKIHFKNNPNHDERGHFAPGNGTRIEPSTSWKEGYAQRAGMGLARYATQHNMSEEAYKKMADDHVASLVKEAAPWTRMHEVSFVAMLGDGRFKSQFETKVSSGLVSEKQRTTAEENMFGLSSDTPAEKRPIYGYMTEHADGVISRDTFQKQYGSVAVHLEDGVKGITTLTGGDSLNSTLAGTTPTLLPTLAKDAGRDIFDVMNDPLRFQKASEVFPYLEAQYHGGVTTKHIKEVVFHEQPQKETVDLLTKHGISYRVAVQPIAPAKKPARRNKKAQTTLDCIAMLPTKPGWFLIRAEQEIHVVDTIGHVIYPAMTLSALVARDSWEPHNSIYTTTASYTTPEQ